MRAGFEGTFGVKLVEGGVTREELELTATLRPKYVSQEWLRKR
jgi:hypothetical protein